MSLHWSDADDTMFREDVKQRNRQLQVEEAVARFVEWRLSWQPPMPIAWTASDRVWAKTAGIDLT